MAISFGGLATGMDTAALVDALMSAERAPLTRMESDKIWLNNRLGAFREFDGKLNGFLDNIQNLGDRDQYFKRQITSSSEDFFTATATNEALDNTSYQIEVQSLAQVQKSYSNAFDGLGNDIGFSSKTDQVLGTGAFVITVDGTDHTIDITAENNSLEGLMEAINNNEDIGVSAAIINDGTDSPYRLTFTGQTVGSSFTVDSSGLTGGTESFNNFEVSQPATQAHIIVDGLDIYSDSNTISEAIPGVTLDLLKAESGTNSQISISQDTGAVTQNLNNFISGYNEVVSFVTSQSTLGETEGGILAGDSGLNAIKRHLQDMLTTLTDNNGTFKALSELGLETQKDGTISLNSETLNNAIDTDLDSLVSLLAGEEDGDDGLAAVFDEYLETLTNSTDGLLAGRSESITSNLSRIDDRIEQMEIRLAKREETLKSQFLAMEQMVSIMNAQSDYLTQQMSAMSNLWNYNK